MVNMGVSFRNSKWTSYSRRNISLKLSEHYTKMFKLALALVILLTILFSTPFRYNYPFLWSFSDSFISTLCFSYFFLLFYCHFITYYFYNWTLNWLFGKTEKKQVVKSTGTGTIQNTFSLDYKNYLIYSWLGKGTIPTEHLEKLFENGVQMFWVD